jgi:chorismate synthase
VAAGAILAPALEEKKIRIGTHIAALHGVKDRSFDNYEADIALLQNKAFPALSDIAEEQMKAEILFAKAQGDSVGGILESVITGIPAGVGEPWFDSAESQIAHILFSIGGIKGVSFGDGFELAEKYGSEANDNFAVEEQTVITTTNHNGGINGGITNGMPLIVQCAVKPTPSIYKEQQSVNLTTMQNTPLTIEGRHDPAIIHRVRSVVDAALVIVTADMLTQRYGTDYLVTK